MQHVAVPDGTIAALRREKDNRSFSFMGFR